MEKEDLVLSAFANAFRTPDLRRKLLFVLLIIAIFRLGSQIPTPGVDVANVKACVDIAKEGDSAGLYNLVNLFRLHLPPALRSAQIETLRTQLFKIGARVRQTARCVRIHLASGWPFQSQFQTVARLSDTS